MLPLLILAVFGACALFAALAPQFGKKPHGAHLEKIRHSPQYQVSHFENTPKADPQISPMKMLKVLWETVAGGAKRRPQSTLPSSEPTFDKTTGAYLTWFGHSTFLYEIDGKRILFDPMLGSHASPIPGLITRYPYRLPARAEELPHLDAVIISHDHYDHLDYKTILTLRHKVDRFIAPLGVGSHLSHWGVPSTQITELDWWGETALGDITIRATPSQHFSGRSVHDRKKTLWAGWIIQNKTANVFFGGDSGYFDGFAEIGRRYGPFDLTLLDSGQYNPLWKEVHMLPEQSVRAHEELKGKVYMPIHWAGFTLSTHAWKEPPERAQKAADESGVEMITPMIGERFSVLTERPHTAWWKGLV